MKYICICRYLCNPLHKPDMEAKTMYCLEKNNARQINYQ